MSARPPLARGWMTIGARYLPFADAASQELPLGRLLRLSLFQVSVGMAVVLLTGTLNRVMIVELGVPAWLVALMVALPLIFAPLRALIGFRSDTYRSVLGWRRAPFIWFGSLLQFGGFAIMPFALLLLSSGRGPVLFGGIGAGEIGAALAFLLVGAGLHTTQTAGLALASDLATPDTRPRAVALLYVMLLVGMAGSALVLGFLLRDFDEIKLIRVIQGAALLTMVLNMAALWKQEARNPAATAADRPRPTFREAWGDFSRTRRARRLLVAVALGTAGFSMQDILLEPYGGQILHLGVGATTTLTAMLAGGTLAGFALAARLLKRGGDPHRLSALGALCGVAAFACVIVAAPLGSPALFAMGATAIGFGGGLFSVGTLTAAMALAESGHNGMALGAWGAVQATAAGAAIACGGVIRDIVGRAASDGLLGPALAGPDSGSVAGYAAVYHIEIVLLFASLAAIGPLVSQTGGVASRKPTTFGLAEMPG